MPTGMSLHRTHAETVNGLCPGVLTASVFHDTVGGAYQLTPALQAGLWEGYCLYSTSHLVRSGQNYNSPVLQLRGLSFQRPQFAPVGTPGQLATQPTVCLVA